MIAYSRQPSPAVSSTVLRSSVLGAALALIMLLKLYICFALRHNFSDPHICAASMHNLFLFKYVYSYFRIIVLYNWVIKPISDKILSSHSFGDFITCGVDTKVA